MTQENNGADFESTNTQHIQDLLTRLYPILQEQLGLYRQLLEVARQEQRAILQQQLQPLIHSMEQQETLIGKTRAIEKQRQLLIQNLAQLLDKPSEKLRELGLENVIPDLWG